MLQAITMAYAQQKSCLVRLSHYPPVLGDVCPKVVSCASPTAPLSNPSPCINTALKRRQSASWRQHTLHLITPYMAFRILEHHDLIMGDSWRDNPRFNVNKAWYHVVVHQVPVTAEVHAFGGARLLEQWYLHAGRS